MDREPFRSLVTDMEITARIGYRCYHRVDRTLLGLRGPRSATCKLTAHGVGLQI